MISVLVRFPLRNYCFQIQTVRYENATVNDENISAPETARVRQFKSGFC
jgi:hypothetical protein